MKGCLGIGVREDPSLREIWVKKKVSLTQTEGKGVPGAALVMLIECH